MRRMVALVLSLGLLVLTVTGCRNSGTETLVEAGDFSCHARIAYKNMAIEGALTRKAAGTLELAFSEPATLKGITAVWDGEKVTMSLYGLTFDINQADVPDSALGTQLVSVLDAALRGEGDRKTEGDTFTVTGTCEAGDYTLVCDKTNGKPLSLSVPSVPLSATFSDFTEG